MSNREKIMRHLNIVGQLQPALHQPQHAPTGDLIDNAHFRAYTRASHDVGGEADIPITWENRRGNLGAQHLRDLRSFGLARGLEC